MNLGEYSTQYRPGDFAGDDGGSGQAEMSQHGWGRELLFDDLHSFVACWCSVSRDIFPEQQAQEGCRV